MTRILDSAAVAKSVADGPSAAPNPAHEGALADLMYYI